MDAILGPFKTLEGVELGAFLKIADQNDLRFAGVLLDVASGVKLAGEFDEC